jgi:hypothetical protein
VSTFSNGSLTKLGIDLNNLKAYKLRALKEDLRPQKGLKYEVLNPSNVFLIKQYP